MKLPDLVIISRSLKFTSMNMNLEITASNLPLDMRGANSTPKMYILAFSSYMYLNR